MTNVGNLTKEALYYQKSGVEVHIKLKDGYAYNGWIKDVMENEYVVIEDRLFGEIVLFFPEVLKIARYERRKSNDSS